MKEFISIREFEVFEKDLQQILLRGKGDEKFEKIIKEKFFISVPNKNLAIVQNEDFLFSKQSFDQWSIILLNDKKDDEIHKIISEINSNEDMLASNYSYGQVYFEVSGNKRNFYLNKLTHFDLRSKIFKQSTVAQTLIARIDCTIYNLGEKYLISCNKSYEDYFKERLMDSTIY
tara:strand:+ start:888 stop:1409 length:522 start_codon:yes stop_codon:yes gene_type:complete